MQNDRFPVAGAPPSGTVFTTLSWPHGNGRIGQSERLAVRGMTAVLSTRPRTPVPPGKRTAVSFPDKAGSRIVRFLPRRTIFLRSHRGSGPILRPRHPAHERRRSPRPLSRGQFPAGEAHTDLLSAGTVVLRPVKACRTGPVHPSQAGASGRGRCGRMRKRDRSKPRSHRPTAAAYRRRVSTRRSV